MKTKTLVLIIAAVLVFGAGLYLTALGSASKKTYADDNSPVMYFYSEGCHYCQQEIPILEELAAEGFRVKLMDVGAHPEYWQQYEISGTPTFIAANGDKQVGFTEKIELQAWLEKHNARIQASTANK